MEKLLSSIWGSLSVWCLSGIQAELFNKHLKSRIRILGRGKLKIKELIVVKSWEEMKSFTVNI